MMLLLLALLQEAKGSVEWEFLVAEAGKAGPCAAVIKKRLELAGAKGQVETLGNDRIRVTVTGVDMGGAADLKALIVLPGRLEVRELAGKDAHEKWKKEREPLKRVPSGLEAVVNNETLSNEHAYLGGDYVLVLKSALATGSDVKSARAVKDGSAWKLELGFTDGSGRKIDGAAKRLFGQTPRGVLGLLVDGQLLSKLVVGVEKYGGTLSLGGAFDEDSAERLSIAIRSGPLPALIGRNDDGNNFSPGTPEKETFK